MDSMNIVIRGRFRDRQDFFHLVGRAAWGAERPAPTNLDGLVDLIRETGLKSITVYGTWEVAEKAATTIHQVCTDLGVGLRLPSGAI